jgi:hypothetical protein
VLLTSTSQTHFNIAKHAHQVFFFLGTFVDMDRLETGKAPANTCVR